MTKLSIVLLAIVVVVELIWLGGIDRYAEQYSVSIEATELSHNSWPAPGNQADVAGGRSKTPSTPGILVDKSQSSAAGSSRTAF